jgi:Flp pilus assembly protein TadD
MCRGSLSTLPLLWQRKQLAHPRDVEMNRDTRFLLLLPALIVFILYLPVLHYEFVWDDTVILQNLSLYHDPAMWAQALAQPISSNYFRPLGMLAFILQLRAWGFNSALFHLTGLTIFAVNTFLVAILAGYLIPAELDPGKRLVLRMSAGLFYGLHPALLEGVVFISSLFDPLATLFLLLALLADGTIRHPMGRPLSVALAFLLAALSKEFALAFVIILPLWHMASKQRYRLPVSQIWPDVKKTGDWTTYLATLIAAGVSLVLRYAALGYLLFPGAEETISTGNPLQHLLLIGRSITRYIVLTFWPFTTLSPIHYASLPVPMFDITAWAAFIAAVAWVVVVVILVRKAPQSGWLAIAGTLALLPVINIFPLELDGGAFVAQRFLLFPMVLFVLALISLASTREWSVNWGGVPRWTFPLLWLFACVATLQLALPHWRNEVTLWSWGERRAPVSPLPPTNLALAYINQGSYQLALQKIDRALALDPEQANAWNNLGLAQFSSGNYAAAQSAFEEAVRLDEDNAMFWNNLAASLREQDQLEDAEQILLNRVLPLDSALPIAYVNLAVIYLRSDRPDLAAQSLQEALRWSPMDQSGEVSALMDQVREPGRWLRLGNNLLSEDDPEGAVTAFQQADALGAAPADVAAGLSSALIQLRAYPEAETVLQRALEIVPDDARLYNNLGMLARERGDLDAAREHFTQAVTLDPTWELPKQNLESLEKEQ